MLSQGQRLLGLRGRGHGIRGSGGRVELIEAHGYDTKFAMHAARLGFQGVELLETGRLALPIEGEPADWLRGVRRGEVPFTDWWDRCLALDARLGQLATDDTIPEGPDRVRIESYSTEAHLEQWEQADGNR